MGNPAGDLPVISDTCNSRYAGQFCKVEHKQPRTACQPPVGFGSHSVCGLLGGQKPLREAMGLWRDGSGEEGWREDW